MYGVNKSTNRKSENNACSRASHDINGIGPISFIAIVGAVIKNGIQFNGRDEGYDNLLLAYVKHKELTVTGVDFFEFLI